MRKLLIPIGVILALLVAVHYARWPWGHGGGSAGAGGAGGNGGNRTCGLVASVYHDTRGEGQPTFVDLGHDYPNQELTVLIWQRDLDRFNPAPDSWQGRTICVTGEVRLYKGRREIIAYSPGQIRFRK